MPMQHYKHIESSLFKVKQAVRFKEELYGKFPAEYLDVALTKDGIKIRATNYHHDGIELEEFIQDNLAEGQTALLHSIQYNDAKENLYFSVSLVTDIAINVMDCQDVVNTLIDNEIPRYLTAIDTTFNSNQGLWLEAGKKYLAIEASDNHFTVQHDSGQKVKWAKGEFNAN